MNKEKINNMSISELFGKGNNGSAILKGLTEEVTDEQVEEIVNADNNKVYKEIDINALQEYEFHEYGKNRGDMKSLAQTIEKFGVIQPIIVRKKTDDMYEILAGHRRTEASKMANKKTVPCFVVDIKDDDIAKLYVHITNYFQTNISDLPPSRKARVITDFYDELIKMNKNGTLDDFLEVEELQKSKRTDEIAAEKFNTSTKKIEKLRRIDKNLIYPLKTLLDAEFEEKKQDSSYKPKLPEGSAEYLAYIPEEWQESVYNAIVDENCNMTIKLKIAKEIYEAYKDNMTIADLDNYLFNKVPFYYEDEDNEDKKEKKNNYNIKLKLSQDKFEKYFSKSDSESDKVSRTLRALEVLDYCERHNIEIPV